MSNSTSGRKKLHIGGHRSVLGVLVLLVIAIQVLRFIRVGPQLAEVSAATMSEAAEKMVATVPRDAGDMSEYRDLMQHTEQVVRKFTSPTTRPVEPRILPVNPFRTVRTQNLSDDHAEQERSETLEAAQGLQLESVIESKVAPVCMINNILLREKQEVDGFVVDQIKPDSVVVRRGGYRFELKLVR